MYDDTIVHGYDREQDVVEEEPYERTELDREIEDLLYSKKVGVDFTTPTPLSEVLSFLKDSVKIDFRSDIPDGVDPLITMRIKQRPLPIVLDWVATLSGTNWDIRHGGGAYGLPFTQWLSQNVGHVQQGALSKGRSDAHRDI